MLAKFKAICKQILLSWADLLFPPICALCKERGQNLLCTNCQEGLLPPDPAYRCKHCFVELDYFGSLCKACAHKPKLGAPHAFLFEESPIVNTWKSLLIQDEEGAFSDLAASLFVLQWSKLDWPLPDRIAFIPAWGKTKQIRSIAERGAAMLGKTITREFKMRWISPFEWRLVRTQDDLLEGQIICLIDFEGESKWLSQALSELWPAYPKEVYILSLFAEKKAER